MDTATKTAPAIPFEIASAFSSRQSLNIPTTTLDASAPTSLGPISVPAVGYLWGILVEVTLTATGGTTPTFTADAPFNVFQSVTFRNPSGVNLINPLTGYDWYLTNKYGAQAVPGFGPYADPKYGTQYSDTDPNAHFFLWLPLGLDASEAYGVIPAMAANAAYQFDIMLAAQSTVLSSNPTVSVSFNTTAWYFDSPQAVDELSGMSQATMPPGMPATSIWLKESPAVTPGQQLIQSVNVGNVIRNHIFTLRDSSGARVEADLPDIFEVYIDNDPRFRIRNNEWKFLIERWYGLGGTLDSVGGRDTGVRVIPWHALLGSMAGDPANTRAQLLPTLDATQLQFKADVFGANASKFHILTETVTTTDSAFLWSK